MFEFPSHTGFYRKIPKQKFYEKADISSDLKRIFIDQVKSIEWQHKLAENTLNLPAGSHVTEIEVFEIRLHSPLENEQLLKQIDAAIPYHLLFLLEWEGQYQAWIAYKEISSLENQRIKVNQYFHTPWLSKEELPLKIEGLNLDEVYENFVRQIAGNQLEGKQATEPLAVAIDHSNQKRQLEKQIHTLENKMRREKQLNKQVLINQEIKKLKQQWKEL
ncbi:DUF4391 domain-containing protein [Enterococcus cecorum]|uniref:DUF4391 domain-containing protein n=1 Tax=Enterococcus cecorum TaxID=44008 RepID=A0A200I598_9ENTE|nr:DUF4391 domain-containing protein [Enterococcus cecorum]OUZ19551.1 hypothetical protein A5869_001205 [Enterococcus cecorum]